MDNINVHEEWKPVAGYDGKYEVSSRGRVKSLIRGRERLLACSVGKRGYPAVSLKAMGIFKTVTVHRLVAKAFVINHHPERFDVVNHMDGNKSNNVAANLEWCDKSHNEKHAHATGLKAVGQDRWLTKLTENDVRSMRRMRLGGATYASISKAFGITQSHAQSVCTGRTWAHTMSDCEPVKKRRSPGLGLRIQPSRSKHAKGIKPNA